MKRTKRYTMKVVAGYFILASSWVLFSDKAVESLASNVHMYTWAQSFKGHLFVVITSCLLWVMVRKYHRAIERASDIDKVTGLHSPTVFFRHIQRTLQHAHHDDHYVLFLLDIDHFKPVSDRLGIVGTNDFLKEVAFAIHIPSADPPLSSRLYADGFISLVKLSQIDQTEPYLAKVQRQFNQCARRHQIESTCSIGVALFPSDGEDASTLFRSVNQALNEAKKRKDFIQYHDIALTEQERQRQDMVCELRRAIDDKSIDIVYQPKYDLNSGQLMGVEVLSRWVHPRYGAVSPGVFIALAEEHNLCRALTALVLEKASVQLKASHLLGQAIPSVAVNISAVELNSDIDMKSIERYVQSDLEFAQYLCLEITETATLNDIDQSARAIKTIKQYGVSFSMDDFGVGYTSFGIFSKLEVDEIKVDRSFIQNIGDDPHSKAITSGIIDIAKGFGIHVVAEGVENADQLEILKQLKCDQVQGFYLGRPMPLAQLKDTIASFPMAEVI